ncbi:MAG: cyclic nucleotide-binding domain-containing protein [Lachnospiraceae bacterium]|nr:cyclic nucleotide-binding domain-containing protein [Lachnospiraceae bacterium]
MGTVIYNPGDTIFRAGDKISALAIVIKGNVAISAGYNKVVASSGNMLGITDVYADEYLFDYVADTEVSVYSYNYRQPEDLLKMLTVKPELAGIFVSTMFRAVAINIGDYEKLRIQCNSLYKYIKDEYDDYRKLAAELGANIKALAEIEDLEPYEIKESIDSWLVDYYKRLHAMPNDNKKAFYGLSKSICYGTVMEAAKHLVTIMELNNDMAEYISGLEELIMNSSEADLYSVYTGLAFKALREKKDSSVLDVKIDSLVNYLTKSVFSDKELVEERVSAFKAKKDATDFGGDDEEAGPADDGKLRADLVDSIDTILEYSRLPDEVTSEFKEAVEAYKALTDKNIVDSDSRAIRKKITKLFFEIYEAIALRTFNDFGYSNVINMFLYFGYVDEELAGARNAEILYKMAEKKYHDPNEHVFLLIDWLKLVYEGKKEPSKNELDTDYTTFLREEKRSGKISESEEADLLKDNVRKFKYELNNAVKSVNQITFGRITNYCPIFSEHNVLKSLDSMFVSYVNVAEATDKLRKIDYSAYYRETSYSSPEHGVKKEFIQTEVLPDVVLMPNVGSRGAMWQEYWGNYRNTPARFFVSIFCSENLEDVIIRMTGEFRWELCRRIQGARWNDITEKSLTSEYSDYAQFYRKNSDLSTEAKEKVKLNLQRCKNSFKELFVREYMVWIKFEAAGSARLNKVSRNILYNYCTFSPEVREVLKTNPMFKDIMERYNNRKLKKIKSVDLLFAKILKEGGEITPELQAHRDFVAL